MPLCTLPSMWIHKCCSNLHLTRQELRGAYVNSSIGFWTCRKWLNILNLEGLLYFKHIQNPKTISETPKITLMGPNWNELTLNIVELVLQEPLHARWMNVRRRHENPSPLWGRTCTLGQWFHMNFWIEQMRKGRLTNGWNGRISVGKLTQPNVHLYVRVSRVHVHFMIECNPG